MDATALQRQRRRIERLKLEGVNRTTVFVHKECKPALEALRRLLIDPHNVNILSELLSQIEHSKTPTNIAKVQHLSPFRYPGGKTWLAPEICRWLTSSTLTPTYFIEPFAGGGIASLTVASEGLAEKIIMSEIDEEVAAVWELIFQSSDKDLDWLYKQIESFDVTLDNVKSVIANKPRLLKTRAFRTIIKNRMQRGGILATHAGLLNAGEDGRGLRSRWYPETLVNRIKHLRLIRDRVSFQREDAFKTITSFKTKADAFFFIDPPYTSGGKNAGKRLYNHSDIDHKRLFALISEVRGSALLTYDDSQEIRGLAKQFGFKIEQSPMKSTHHVIHKELLIFKN